ncbi:hypothetical protein FJY84_08005 [Candidatus Bathyarchaeota archaeon]|nr:hypothetical protein [Candidatus Bathyarchaeota archaeon]
MSKTFNEDEVNELRYAAKRIMEILLPPTQMNDSTEWKDDPITDKQSKLLKSRGYSIEGLTKGKASEIIEKILKEPKR